MSASRAIASAKNKRAGLNSPNPANPLMENQGSSQYNPNFEQPPPSPGPITKLTIPQAIQMIVSRLDLIESKMGELEQSVQETKEFGDQTQNKYLVDASVFDSIVSRISSLEKNANSANNSDVSPNTLFDIKRVEGTIGGVHKELNDFKNDFIKLQSYVMDTNAKLTEVVFSIPVESMVDYRDIFANTKNVEENISDIVNISNITPPSLVRNGVCCTREYNINVSDEENQNNKLNNVFVASDILLGEDGM